MPRRLISTGSPLEKTVGYSRAVVDGDFASSPEPPAMTTPP